MPFGPKTKCPWITLNGEEIPDSEFVIEHLKDHFNVKLDSKLSAVEEANLETVKILIEEHLFWCVIAWRYWLDRCESFMKSQVFSKPLSWFFPIFMVSGIKKKSMIQGIGKHSEVEIYQICKKDCQTLSTILGTKKYFGGDTPCTADCAIFGGLSQLMWNAPESKYEDLLKEKYKNLAQYCLRMKENAFPDWNNLLVQ
ncbi:UNVERIFIED_CONTAM: hypothetical protein GTU68_013741 [Idotea baltica]|nr:hypothetical protein [Idotea baltica]